MIASELQVHKDTLFLLKTILHYVNTSPKILRFMVGGLLVKSIARSISEIRKANMNEGRIRIEHINEAIGELDDAKTYVRVFTEELLPNKKYEEQIKKHEKEPQRYPEPRKSVHAWNAAQSSNATHLFDKIGKQLNGWKRSEQSRRNLRDL